MVLLYEHPLSPYAQKVKIALAEKGIPFEARLPDFMSGQDADFALLEAIAGVVPTRSGTIQLRGRDVTTSPPESRALSLVYQHAYLFPHLDVRRNVEYGAADTRIAEEMLERFGLSAPGGQVLKELGITADAVVEAARRL